MESTVFTGHEDNKYKISSSSVTKMSMQTGMISWVNETNPTTEYSKLAKPRSEVLLNNSNYECLLG